MTQAAAGSHAKGTRRHVSPDALLMFAAGRLCVADRRLPGQLAEVFASSSFFGASAFCGVSVTVLPSEAMAAGPQVVAA